MALEARNITFFYRGKKKRPVLNGFELAIEPGERVGLRGKSGRGKTTLCRLLAGYEKPVEGDILLDGRQLNEYRGVCPVQMIWQHPEMAVDPRLRMKESLTEAGIRISAAGTLSGGRGSAGITSEPELLDRLGIRRGWLERFPSELSGGELQRFCLARALRPEARFLLCDEITAMLDLVTQARIWKFLLEESERRSLGILVVSHDEELLRRVCTRVVDLE